MTAGPVAMDPDLLRRLIEADDAVECETPPDFAWEAAVRELDALVRPLSDLAGRRFVLDTSAQDASFYADLMSSVEHPTPQGGAEVEVFLSLRFSAFGKLFTTWSNSPPERRLDPAVIGSLVRRVEEAGFTHVDADALAEPYGGGNPVLKGYTWWGRYFDYL